MKLLVNIDHIATLRNARGENYPDPAAAASVCEQAGASGIVFHLRSDRRHIVDEDVYRLKKGVKGLLDFEMAATEEMIEICLNIQPDICTLVPEGREELTTEGGLNLKFVFNDFAERVFPAFRDTGIAISLFLDPIPQDIELAHKLGANAVELHTGRFANAPDQETEEHELDRLAAAAIMIHEAGMQVNAGHGLNQKNLSRLITHVPHIQEVSIGHALVADALYDGLHSTVKKYLQLISD